MEINVLFSAISTPEEVIVESSLRSISSKARIIVLTSKQKRISWENRADKVEITRFSSRKRINRFVKIASNRSSFFRKTLHILLKKLFSKSIWIFMPPQNARHFESLQILKGLPSDSWVFLVDSRDLVFQIDPCDIAEQLVSQGDLHFFDEGQRSFKTGSRQFNSESPANWNWAKMLVNHDEMKLKSISQKWIINSGCITGRCYAVIEFLEKSCKLLENSQYCNTDFLDQASTNVVVYEELITTPYKVHNNGEFVLNMCGKIEKQVSLIDNQLKINGITIPIVHQFDRYGTWNSTTGFDLSRRDYNLKIFN